MDTNYFEDELWKCETIENEAKVVLHHIHVSINQTRGSRINFESAGDKGDARKNSKNASQVLRNPKVQEYKKIRQQEILADMGYSAENVARKLIEMGFAEKGDTVYTPQVQLKALDLLQKQLGVQQSKSTIDANVREQVVIVNDLPEDEDGNKAQ